MCIRDSLSAEQHELRDGLLDHPAHIDPKFLYDALGSSLFTAITQLPEYYPTRCEAEIFARYGQEMCIRDRGCSA